MDGQSKDGRKVFYCSEVLRNLSDGYSFPRVRLDFANKGVTYLNRLHKLKCLIG